jgi:hypothetical protein
MAHDHKPGGGARTVVIDVIVAALTFSFGAVVIYDSIRLGWSWGADGPQAGYFPFYIGLLICIGSVVVLAQSIARWRRDAAIFVEAGQFKQVLKVLVPSVLYVLAVQFIGLYAASALFIGLFMKVIGGYGALRSATVGILVSVVAFMLFEIWFQIPLPKGPLEALLGY